MRNGHGGNVQALARHLGCPVETIIDMSSNLNPFGPPEGLLEHLQECVQEIVALPEVDALGMIRDFAGFYDLDPDRVLAGNGTTELIYALPQMLKTRKALILAPTYADYANGCRLAGIEPVHFFLKKTEGFRPDLEKLSTAVTAVDTVFFCNPNNPSGILTPKQEIEALVREHPKVRFVIDESYLPFVFGGEEQSLTRTELPNIISLNSMSKVFRIPGLRVGFLIATQEMVQTMVRYAQPWAVNTLAQSAVKYLMGRKTEIREFLERTRQVMQKERENFLEVVANWRQLRFFPSSTYFLLVSLENGSRSADLCQALGREKILVRDCANIRGLSDRFIRVSLKTPKENGNLLEQLSRHSNGPKGAGEPVRLENEN